MSFRDKVKNAWNAFRGREPTGAALGPAYSFRPDRFRMMRGSERSIVAAIYNRIAMDVTASTIVHAKLDNNDRFSEPVDSGLNRCLTLEANLDQTGRAFLMDAVLSMFDEGCVALVPTDIDDAPTNQNAKFDILTMRTGRIVEWYPDKVKVNVYNQAVARREDIIMSKTAVAIIENPFYAIMNEPNSTGQRLIRKLAMLDMLDEENCSGKLDIIVQLPFSVRSEARKKDAEKRRNELISQLAGDTKYGVAYTDASEHITQLNRSLDNQLLNQIEYLKKMLDSQFGLTDEIMNGTADESVMNNYYSRTIEPILSAFADEIKRKFLSEEARDDRESICIFRDPFKLIPATAIAEMADKLTRNEIMTSNEIRGVIGLKPSLDPEADALMNKNISKSKDEQVFKLDGTPLDQASQKEEIQNVK